MTVRYVEHWGSDERVVESARMSTDGSARGWGSPEEPGDEKLLRFLWENQHSTPFEFAGLTVEVETPIFVVRQWMRHRTQSYTERSLRYVEFDEDFFVPDEWRTQAKKNKQSSGGPLAETDQVAAFDIYEDALKHAEGAYRALLFLGICREQARMILPLSTMTKFRASANLRNWLAFARLRLAPDAQAEIRDEAHAVAAILREHFPRTYGLFAE